ASTPEEEPIRVDWHFDRLVSVAWLADISSLSAHHAALPSLAHGVWWQRDWSVTPRSRASELASVVDGSSTASALSSLLARHHPTLSAEATDSAPAQTLTCHKAVSSQPVSHAAQHAAQLSQDSPGSVMELTAVLRATVCNFILSAGRDGWTRWKTPYFRRKPLTMDAERYR
ncbi:hypothetical protein KUCAC02_026089, partial [Chaenocephalus aceratus]